MIDGALAERLPCLRGLHRRFFLEELAARDHDVAPSGLELRDAEAQPLADVGPALDASPVDLGSGAERAHAADLHAVAALDLARDDAFHRDAIGERLLELARQVAPSARDTLEDDRPALRAVVHDGRLDLVALLQGHRSGLLVAELGDVDGGFRLAAHRHECGRRAHRDHPASYDLASLQPPFAPG